MRGNKKPATLAKTVKAMVSNAITKKAETKTAIYYSNSTGLAGDGTYALRSWAVQNQLISNTVSDLKRMIPFVKPGTGENQRIGDKVTPLSLTCHGTVKVTLAELGVLNPNDLFAVIYVLEHVTFKSYSSLIAGNDFTQLLKTGENTTVRFNGEVWHSQMPVADQYYRLLKKRVIRLRYAGSTAAGAVSVANSHDYLGKFSLGLSKKQLPLLKYPEDPSTAGANDPLNVAPFFAMGFYWADGQQYTSPQTLIETQYVTCMKYKDM